MTGYPRHCLLNPKHNPVSYLCLSTSSTNRKHTSLMSLKEQLQTQNGNRQEMLSCVQCTLKISAKCPPQSLLHLVSPRTQGSACHHVPRAGLQEHTTTGHPSHLALYMAARNPNPGPHACVASALPTSMFSAPEIFLKKHN